MTISVSVLDEPDYTAQRLRQAWAFGLASQNLSLQTRNGVRYTNGSDFNVTTSGMTATVAPGSAVIQSPTFAQGPYVVTSDANVALTIPARHATLTRIDTVYIQVRDDDVDLSGAQDGRVLYQAGVPGSGAAPTLSGTVMRLADITVPPGAGLISVSMRRPWAAALGGIQLCGLATDIAHPNLGLQAYETDTGKIKIYDGTGWRTTYTPPAAWTNVPTGWFNGDFGNLTGFPLKYWIEDSGFITFWGRITRPAPLAGSMTGAMQLPVGFRPAFDSTYAVGIATNSGFPSATGRINIETNGGVNLFMPGSQTAGWMALDGIRFPLG